MADAPHFAGPDLGAGIPSSSLADGHMVRGHVHEESVLVARRGGEIFAIGATCTHYGGPLHHGLLVGDTVRCPWHHACFSLRTGEALEAPALDPVACYAVEERDGRIVVGERIEPAISRPSIPDAPSSIVIVGGGAAGVAAAEMVRRLGYAGPVQILEALDTMPVDRPNLSKEYLSGEAEEAWAYMREPDFYAAHDIELVRSARVSRIDVANRVVRTEDGREFPFGRLLLAMGAEPVRLPVPGADLPHVHYLRTLQDSKAIIASVAHASRVVVIGASFIGLEAAASLRKRGVSVSVVAPDRLPLARVFGDELGQMISDVHRAHGVEFHLEQKVVGIERLGDPARERLRVVTERGDAIEGDAVVVGIGVKPNVALGEQAGMTVDRGVVVNEYLETSVPGIFAAGDLARWPDARTGAPTRVEHWVVAERMGQTAARNLLGYRESFRSVPFFWSRHFDVAVDYVGHAEGWDRIDIEGDVAAKNCRVAYWLGGRQLAVATVGRERESLEAEEALVM